MGKIKIHSVANSQNFKKVGTVMAKRINATMGLCCVVLGVLLLAFCYIASLTTNYLLFTGLIFIIIGIAGYIYGLKKE